MSEAQLSGRESPEEGPSKKGHRRVKSMVKELEQSKPGEMAPGASNGDTSISRISGPNVSGNESLIASSPDSSALANQSSLNTSHSNFNDAHFDHSFDSASSSTTALSQQDKDDAAAEAAEESDVFLPLSPHPGSASPFKIGFNAGHSPSPTTPSFPPSLTAAERREHSRRHSRIHSRNLSVFFPKPGSEEANELASSVPSPGTAAGSHLSPLHIPNANVRAYATEGANGEAKVYRPPALAKTSPQGSTSPVSHTHTRRGHHHRHSMSHSFNEPSMPVTPDGSGSSTPLSASAPKVASALSFSTPTSLPTGTGSSLRNKYGHLPALIRCALVCAFHLPFRTQASLALAVAELGLGGLLWIYGQSGESLAVTGLGYLVVFDAVGALCNVLVENRQDVEVLYEVMSPGARDHLRHPFGTHRLTTLAHFAQAIYLLFSGVYVCKESIEHVLLLHEPVDSGSGADGHGSAHGSMGHGEGRGVASAPADEWLEIWISMPTGLLFLATACCLCTALLLSNHVKMTEAVGPSTYALRARSPINALSLLSNPFSLLVLFFSSILAVASFTISAVQLAPLDKVLALLESIAMFYVAYPAAEATGKVLLQVAPPKEAPAMRALYKGIKDIEGHPSVLFVPKPHVWQLTPHPREDEPDEENHGGMLSLSRSRRLARNSPVGQSHCLLVANVKIHLKGDVKDDELLSVTQYARERCAKAFRGGTDGDQAIGELHVSCVKGMQDDFLNGDHDHHHHDPDHGHHHHGHHGHHGHHHHHSHQHEHRSHCHSGHDHSHHAH